VDVGVELDAAEGYYEILRSSEKHLLAKPIKASLMTE
jgi:hypothetical protein